MSASDDLSLWHYALDRYARPGVEACCLTLQDRHGWDICELLWIAWLAEAGHQPTDKARRALEDVRRWQREMTWPLRERRRRLKAPAQRSPALVPLRETLKQAEWLAEQEALRQLASLPAEPAWPTKPTPATLVAASAWLGPVDATSAPLLEALFAAWMAADAEPEATC
ncbi:TIGR02444 family protein [Salinicola avicenniae]|uniref:TIGR02444 family protein n=1 Tax=Salinicola avicenniae TaxID=2916836 RepID=UPI0020744D9A|nr:MULTISPECIES: TIGR02444 family protein [unclassified Salinicola]